VVAPLLTYGDECEPGRSFIIVTILETV